MEMTIEDQWIDEEVNSRKKVLLQDAIQNLPYRMKEVIYLRYFEDMEYADIAKLMNIQKQVAINMVYRTINHLRKYTQPFVKSLSAGMLIELAQF